MNRAALRALGRQIEATEVLLDWLEDRGHRSTLDMGTGDDPSVMVAVTWPVMRKIAQSTGVELLHEDTRTPKLTIAVEFGDAVVWCDEPWVTGATVYSAHTGELGGLGCGEHGLMVCWGCGHGLDEMPAPVYRVVPVLTCEISSTPSHVMRRSLIGTSVCDRGPSTAHGIATTIEVVELGEMVLIRTPEQNGRVHEFGPFRVTAVDWEIGIPDNQVRLGRRAYCIINFEDETSNALRVGTNVPGVFGVPYVDD